RRVWNIFSIAGRRASNVASVVHVPSRYATNAGDGVTLLPSPSIMRRMATMYRCPSVVDRRSQDQGLAPWSGQQVALGPQGHALAVARVDDDDRRIGLERASDVVDGGSVRAHQVGRRHPQNPPPPPAQAPPPLQPPPLHR